jgi:hypothetical protein
MPKPRKKALPINPDMAPNEPQPYMPLPPEAELKEATKDKPPVTIQVVMASEVKQEAFAHGLDRGRTEAAQSIWDLIENWDGDQIDKKLLLQRLSGLNPQGKFTDENPSF